MATDNFIREIQSSYPEDASPPWLSVLERLADFDRKRLTDLLLRLRGLPLPELILESSRLRCVNPDSPAGKRQFRQAMTAAISASRVLPYLNRIQELDTQRRNATFQVRVHEDQARELLTKDLHQAVAHILECHKLAPEIEVTIHQISICTSHLAKILPLAAGPTGHKILAHDRKILHQFDNLRHHFEHLDERLPGKNRRSNFVREIDDESGWGLEVGFRTDEQGRLMIDDAAYNMNTPALRELDRVVRENYVRIRVSALGGVVSYYAKRLDQIPVPDEIKWNPMMALGFEFDGGIKV